MCRAHVHCSGLHASHNGPEHWNLFKNCFNINECMTGFVTIVGKGLEYSISHKKLYSFPCEFHHLWTKFRGLAHCASCKCNLPKYYLAGIKQLEIKEYRKDRRKICEARKPTTYYVLFNIVLFSIQSQLMLYWKLPQFWKKWGSWKCVLKMNKL